MILLNSLFSMILLISCDSSQCMKDYYASNKTSLARIRSLSENLATNYTFEKVTIRKKRDEIEVMFRNGSRSNVTMYLSVDDFSLIRELGAGEAESQVLQKFRLMLQSQAFKEILQLFRMTSPKALKLTHRSIFIALGPPLKSSNRTELEGGLLMTFQAAVEDPKIVEKIHENVFLYDTLVY